MEDNKNKNPEEIVDEDKNKEGKGNEEPNKEVVNPSGTENPNDLAQRKYAEGAKKATKALFDKYGVKDESELDAKVNGAISKADFDSLNAKVICSDLGVSKEYRDDVIAIAVGLGKPITEESIKEILSRHPEWTSASDANSPIKKLGDATGKDKPAEPNERELARKLFR